MAQHSDSSSGLGTLLGRGFVGILSITATAVMSTMVQRYLAPPAPAPVPPAAAEASPVVEPGTEPGVEASVEPAVPTIPASEGAIVLPDPNAWEQTQPASPAIDPASEAFNTAPFESGQVAPAEAPEQAEPQGEGSTLREKLDRALQNKWNRN